MPTIISILTVSVAFYSFFKNTTTAISTHDKGGGRWSKVHFKLAKYKSVKPTVILIFGIQ